ncbi:T9SS type A sorting domain-containing protein [candidate division WOR-3 bacterium]|nr:T9SS type A sorting domain-containing protein [candidate division WOR-3 bacterium]
MSFRTLFLLCVLCGSILFAQPYRCDWSVVAQGGGDMSSAAYRCGATAGQTAAGQLTGPAYRALIGFWQAAYEVGIAEKEGPTLPEGLVTRLEAVSPNPLRGRAQVRYSLAVAGPVSIIVHDLAGRQVRTLATGTRPAGRYAADWRGDDDAGRKLADGIYFCRFSSGATNSTQKLILAR